MEYEPLPDPSLYIRLIKLVRSNNSETSVQPAANLQCSLEIRNLADKIDYHALSYQWGEERPGQNYPTVPILVRGNDETTVVQIGKNLATALSRLREHECQNNDELHIWADALSINQDDLVEKDAQIKIMGNIYASATSTKVWLGDEWCDDSILEHIDTVASAMIRLEAFQMSRKAQNAKRQKDIAEYDKWQKMADERLTKVMELPEIEAFPFPEFVRFVELPYWSRGWILQEVALSKSIEFFYGKGSPISMLGFRASIVFVGSQGRYYSMENGRRMAAGLRLLELDKIPALQPLINWKQNATTVIGIWRTYQEEPDKPLPMLRLLSEAHLDGDKAIEFTNPKDRVFAFLGLASDASTFKERLNYNMTTTAVYTETARIMIENGQMDILAYCCDFSGPKYDMPSWVPNWNGMARKPSNGVPYETVFNVSKCSEGQEPTKLPLQRNSLYHLHIYITVLDTIEELGCPWTPDNSAANSLATGYFLKEAIAFCAKSDAKADDIYVNPADRQSAPYLVPVADRQPAIQNFSYDSFVSTRETFREGHARMMCICQRIQYYKDHPDTIITQEELRKNREDFNDDAANYVGTIRDIGSRKLLLSQRGYVGLGPISTQTGDLICIIAGGKFPYVLRKCSQTSRSFQLIGEAYVHGIMYGEALQKSATWTEVELL
jgi:heterokaryon incompatibility protein (HET)